MRGLRTRGLWTLVDLLSLFTSFRTTPVETVLADFPHTACGRALGQSVLGGLRIKDGAAQAMQPEVDEIAAIPLIDYTGYEVPPRTLDAEPTQAFVHVAIDLFEAARSISRGEVRAPASEGGVEILDDLAEIRVTSPSSRLVLHLLSNSRHRALRRLTMQEVHALSLVLPDSAAQALAKMTAEKVEALLSIVELDSSRLVGM